MDPWFYALAASVALCWTSRAKMRTWSALGASSIVGLLLPPVSVGAYMLVDFMAAALVLRKPAGCPQKLVGAAFAGMVAFHIGFIISGRQNWVAYYDMQYLTGWLQLACLAAWGAWDAGLVVVHRRSLRPLLARGTHPR